MIFCLYMCILLGKRLAVFLNSFLLLQSFCVKNAKIDVFKEKNGFESSLYKIGVYAVTNWSLRLKKHTIQLKFG